MPVMISENTLPAIFAITNLKISFLPFKMAKKSVLKLKNTKNSANHTKIDWYSTVWKI